MVEVFGQREDDRELDQFGRLQGETANDDPSLRSSGRITGDKDHEKKNNGNTVKDVRVTVEKTIIDEEGHGHSRHADQDPLQLFDIKWRLAGITDTEAGTVDVQQTYAADDENQNQERPVEVQEKAAVQFDHDGCLSRTFATSCICGVVLGTCFFAKKASITFRAMGAAAEPPWPACSSMTATTISGFP